jgi:hypothetical protein
MSMTVLIPHDLAVRRAAERRVERGTPVGAWPHAIDVRRDAPTSLLRLLVVDICSTRTVDVEFRDEVHIPDVQDALEHKLPAVGGVQPLTLSLSDLVELSRSRAPKLSDPPEPP